MCPHESTATALADRILRTGARQLLLCGDSTLALSTLLELGHRAWEQDELIAAAHPSLNGQGPVPFPVDRVVLLNQRAGDLRREYLAEEERRETVQRAAAEGAQASERRGPQRRGGW